jgi:hypothetical protein
VLVRWIELRSYVGPDRRRIKKFRLFERRKKDLSSNLPAVEVLLRQLHLRVLDVATAREAIAQFHLRLTVATAAARSNDQREAAAQLALVQTKLTQSQAKGGLCSKDVEEMQELTASALTALR